MEMLLLRTTDGERLAGSQQRTVEGFHNREDTQAGRSMACSHIRTP
ncbi:hypothetical protein [uncultured Paraglaciecola sp.]|nr:hypothetical protein [uncultured Paraglaciecola sp.]